MMRILAALVALVVAAALLPAAADTATTETILFIRHAEKSPNGFGQLSCKGLNRALKLAGVIAARYGKVDAVFAPDPSQKKPDGAMSYDYVRPLATVEPTAIRFGLPVHAAIGYTETAKLLEALQAPEYRSAQVLVAWEHHQLNDLVPQLVGSLGGTATSVPEWTKNDFDSIWQVRIMRDGARTSVAFTTAKQGLDGQPDTCPD